MDYYPEGVTGWSCGAFFLNWTWAIVNRTWMGLLALIPYVGFVMSIILGIYGRMWAWQNPLFSVCGMRSQICSTA